MMSNRTIFAGSLLLVMAATGIASGKDPPAAGKKMSMDLYLHHLCEQSDVYFTIERMTHLPGKEIGKSPFDRDDLVPDTDVKTPEAMITKLRVDLKGVAVIRDSNNPSVIHLVDERLLTMPSYVMGKKVDVKFSGIIDDLVSELAKQRKPIESARVGGIGQALGDFRTRVVVDVKNQPVREVLTGCVPLRDYPRVLWEGETWETDGTYMTRIRYTGPLRLPAAEKKQ